MQSLCPLLLVLSLAKSLPAAAAACATPAPVVALQESLTAPVPQDFDPLLAPLPQSQVYFTVMLPARCPGERFPVVLQSHGYGGSRITAVALDGRLYPEHPSLQSLDELAAALPYHGYVVISFDEPGHGASQPRNGGGYARLLDPAAETQAARAILDWAYDHAGDIAAQTEDGSGIAKDLKVGTMGYSYGGSYQLPLAALDARIDTLVPVSAWHSLQYSLLAGGAIKQSWLQILCAFAATPSDGARIGAINTPAMQTICNELGIDRPAAFATRTYAQMLARLERPEAQPEPVDADRLQGLLYRQSMAYFRNQQQAGLPWGYGEAQARLRPVPALFLQGNRDTLFNLTDAYRNWRYFRATGADVRLLSMEGGHLNPLADQVEGSADCGPLSGVGAVLAWFDHYLKQQDDAEFAALPAALCLSATRTVGAPATPPRALALADFPVGAQHGVGAVPVRAASLQAEVRAGGGAPVFVPMATVHGAGRYLAGAPSLGGIEVTRGAPATHAAIAMLGVGIRRQGRLILVDDQLTAFVEGRHGPDPAIDEGDPILLPALGEPLRDGDEIGLLFYEQTVQYSTVVSADGLLALPGAVVRYVLGKPLPHPVVSALSPLVNTVSNPNPYQVHIVDAELPVIVPGRYAGSRVLP